MSFRTKPPIVRGPQYAAIRAFRTESREELISRQKLWLGAGLSGQEARLKRALRSARIAAISGKGYDVARHLTLARMCRDGSLQAANLKPTSGQENNTRSTS